MGEVSNLVVALAVLGIMRRRDALEKDRTSRKEETFVPFNLSPLSQRGQPIPQPAEEARPHIAVATSASHAQSTP